MWGGSGEAEKKHSRSEAAPPDESGAAVAEAPEEEGEELLEVLEHSGSEDELEEKEEGDADAADAASQKPSKIKAVARAVMVFGGGMALCPKVDTLQSQVCFVCALRLRV